MRYQHTNLEVLYEDNHLLAVNKPAQLPTMGVAADRPSLLRVAQEYIRRKYRKPGNVYLGIVSRLDAPVTGVVLLARTSKAAARLNEQFRARRVEKVYLAIVEGAVQPPQATLQHFLRKDERHRRMHTTSSHAPPAVEAVLSYRLVDRRGNYSLLEVRPTTGRKHQIRVQLAKVGMPILGDRKYGSPLVMPRGIALHARHLTVEHPVRKTSLRLAAPTPADWRKYFERAEESDQGT